MTPPRRGLDPTDARDRARPRRRALTLLGLALVLAGGSYALWGVKQLTREPSGADGAGFDRPVARLETLGRARREALDRVRVETALERRLLSELRAEMDVTARLSVMTIRVLLGSALVTAGVVTITVALTEQRLSG